MFFFHRLRANTAGYKLPVAEKYRQVQITGCGKILPDTNYRLRKNTARYKLPVAGFAGLINFI